MNPLDDHELLLWAMRAGLTSDEVRQAVQRGLQEGAIPWQSFNETSQQRQERFQAVQEYLRDQYLAGYGDYLSHIRGMNAQRAAGEAGAPFQKEKPMAPWQWGSNLPSHARACSTGALYQTLASRNQYGRLAMGPEWVKRQGASHLFGIETVTRSSL